MYIQGEYNRANREGTDPAEELEGYRETSCSKYTSSTQVNTKRILH